MTIKQLTRFGLNESLAAAYLLLLQDGELTPPELAKINKETRTNAYSLLDKLTELKLATKVETKKKSTYRAENPVALEKFVQRQRDEALERERLAKDSLPELMNLYFMGNEQPGVRYFQGKKGLREIYLNQIEANEPIYSIESSGDLNFFGFKELHTIRNLFPKNNIHRYGVFQDVLRRPLPLEDRFPIKKSDELMLLHRTWINEKEYTAPVEWAAYGNKLSIISYGKEAIGMIIDSPQIAESFRQLFALLDEGLKRRPDYAEMPRNVKYTAYPESVQK